MGATAPLFLELSGSARERGRRHGEGARSQVRAAVDFYTEHSRRLSGRDLADHADRIGGWRAEIGRQAPDLLDEMDGIAEGAGVSADAVLLLNARADLGHLREPAATRTEARRHRDRGSSLALLGAATGDEHVYVARNWDWYPDAGEWSVVLRIVQPPKPTLIVEAEAGQVGGDGANSAGLALAVTGLDGPGAASGLPRAVLSRAILDCHDLHGALRAVLLMPRCAPASLLLAHRDGAAVALESQAAGARWRQPDGGVLVQGDHHQDELPADLRDDHRPVIVDSLYRVPIVRQRAAAARLAVGSGGVLRAVAGALSDHVGYPAAVCRHDDQRWPGDDGMATLRSSITDLTTGEHRLAAGNPCEYDHELIPWNLYEDEDGTR
ncbi:acyl-coenzyme A--6-aminopenicillanic-acid-acyltransferase form [Jiangella anatolica]|uniref:Acyl-coenzyme A--6-aminopenicillanic-acid-acyltransferase form n=1 Tax=Jiangella anatolica TaxID=2670374 RepID=A0A2W2C858_9ACTN|nr:acyl-coenzyme A--6-aminopenicillanic-acid-acyltransferase form [Jiangella anatolica]